MSFKLEVKCRECSYRYTNQIRSGESTSGSQDLLPVNVSAIIAAIYTGSTVGNMAFIFSSLGIPNTNRWDCYHYRYCTRLNEKIVEVAKGEIEQSLEKEIKETMLYKYGIDKRLINRFVQQHKNSSLTKPSTNELTVGLDVSFDMGWQKRSTGRTYNS